jgi:hypothetical protein
MRRRGQTGRVLAIMEGWLGEILAPPLAKAHALGEV